MAIYQLYEVRYTFIMIKFDDTLDVSTIINDNFTVTKDSDPTPNDVPNPFKEINLTTDYHSTSRTLYLWWNFNLAAGATYTVHIHDLMGIFGYQVPDDSITFDVDQAATPPVDEDPRPSREPVDVEDYTIKYVAQVLNVDYAEASSTLEIVSIDPEPADSYYLSSNYNRGKIEITFNYAPAANFVNSTDFKLQKKPVQTTLSIWENVETLVTADSVDPVVTIYLPSQDATPIYSFQAEDDPETIYWQEGYKYRLIIDKNVSS